MTNRFQISDSQIRKYEERGIVKPARTNQGVRIFSDEDIAALIIAVRYQDLGFSLSEVYQLFTTKKGREGLSTAQECRTLLAELARGEAELLQVVEPLAEKTAA